MQLLQLLITVLLWSCVFGFGFDFVNHPLHSKHSQIGSYFGAELCSLDVDSDGSTDFLLVGAPQFHLPQVKKEGQVYIYSVSDEVSYNIS